MKDGPDLEKQNDKTDESFGPSFNPAKPNKGLRKKMRKIEAKVKI